MSMRYPKEHQEFILANYKGIQSRQLAELVNMEFGTSYTDKQMHAFIHNRHLRSGSVKGVMKGSCTETFPKPIADFITENYKGVGPKQMAERLNAEFGTAYKKNQLKSFYANHKLNSGLDGRFKKGHVPASLGKTQEEIIKDPEKLARVRAACFKPGNEPVTRVPVGTERLRPNNGYWWRKVAEPNVWRQRAILVWEEHNGKIPDGYLVLHLNGDSGDDRIENLQIVSRYQHLYMTRKGLRFREGELTKVGVAIAGLDEAYRRRHESKS